MKKGQRRGRQQQQQPKWKSVSIEWKSGGGSETTYNHYDDDDDGPQIHNDSKPELDLEGQPGEDVAMFYGLEVLDGSQYRVAVDRGGCKQIVYDTTTNDEQQPKKKKQKQETVKLQKATNEGENDHKETSGSHNKSQDQSLPRPPSGEEEEDRVAAGGDEDTATKHEENENLTKKKRKRKKKKKKKKPKGSNEETEASRALENEKEEDGEEGHVDDDDNDEDGNVDSEKVQAHDTTSSTPDLLHQNDDDDDPQVLSLQQSWTNSTGGVILHPLLCCALLKQGFWTPTPIQAATLPAAILGRRNVVGAAPTGSGKTLSFVLPILQRLLEEQQEQQRVLRALILTPTRELALQIHTECEALWPKQCGIMVGGLAEAKQARILKRRKPPIVVATPGRLWEMMSSGEHEHLRELSYLDFLVIDEADRMIQQPGSFPQLVSIFGAIHAANPMDDSDDSEEEEEVSEDEENDDADRLLALPGIRGEAKVTMLTDDIWGRIQHQREENEPALASLPEDEDDEEDIIIDEEDDDEDDDAGMVPQDDEIEALPPRRRVVRQTFVYSATLTLPPWSKFVKPKARRHNDAQVEGAIADILEKACAKGKTKVVDLTKTKTATTKTASSTTKTTSSSPNKKVDDICLPPGLTLKQMFCTQKHKDSHLYAYLMTQALSGPCLIFCNSIAAVRRVTSTLQTLGLDARMLHAQMQQKSRFKSVESLRHYSEGKSSSPPPIVVATDVAARGLDIPNIATVIHYDVARTVDLFVHRSGRTARGIGDDAVGCSLLLISPQEDKCHKTTVQTLKGVSFEHAKIDGRLLAAAQERTQLACKVVASTLIESRAKREHDWFTEKAKEMDLEYEDDNDNEVIGQKHQDAKRRQSQWQQAQQAKTQLKQLLAQPMVSQRYGKFLPFHRGVSQPPVAPMTTDKGLFLDKRKKKRKRNR